MGLPGPAVPTTARRTALVCTALVASACSGSVTGADPDSGSDAQVDPCAPRGAAPGFCPGRGLYSAAIEVELRPPQGATAIYFTVDGSQPTLDSAQVYDGPIAVSGTPERAVVVVRAAALVGSTLANPATHSFVFPEFVVQQPALPAGLPDVWTGDETRPGDYEMDPEVLADETARTSARTALSRLPTVLVTMAHDDLWGASGGIYMNPSQEGPAWERAAVAELIEPDGSSTAAACGIRSQGGSSTQNWKSAKLSLRLLFKSTYGPGRLSYRLFRDSDVTRFDTVVLDAHLNHTYLHPDHDQRVRSQYLRDVFSADLQNAVSSLAPHSRFVHLYLNGLYWGLYELHERPDDAFAADYLGGLKSEYDVLRHNGSTIVAGDASRWQTLFGLVRAGVTTADAYAAVGEHLDIDDFIDYMLVNFYAGNDDWPRHNWYATCRRTPDGRFRFHSWDAEHVLKDLNQDSTGASNEDSPGEIYQALLAHQAFRDAVVDRAQILYGVGGALHVNDAAPAVDPDRPEDNRPGALYRTRADEIRDSIILELARWGDNQREPPYTIGDWQAEYDWLVGTYFPARSGIARGQLP